MNFVCIPEDPKVPEFGERHINLDMVLFINEAISNQGKEHYAVHFAGGYTSLSLRQMEYLRPHLSAEKNTITPAHGTPPIPISCAGVDSTDISSFNVLD